MANYFAYVLSNTSAVPASVGAQFSTRVMVFGKPTATPVLLEFSLVTSVGPMTYTATQEVNTTEFWSEVTVFYLDPGVTVTSISVRELTPSESVVVPIDGQGRTA